MQSGCVLRREDAMEKIKNIRKKLGVDYIETIRGAGYKIEKEN